MKTYTRLVVGALAAFVITLTINTQAQPFAPTNAPGAQAAGPEYVPGEVLVKFREDVTDDQIATAFRGAGLQMLKHIQTPAMRDNGQIGITRAASRIPVEQAIALLSQLPGIEYAQPNWIYRHHIIESNDKYFLDGSLWGMYGDTSTPKNIYGSQAAEAWAAGSAGSKEVYVGVIDEGIQYDHPDLAENMWKNSLELSGKTGVDEDANGYTDDIYGWNAFDDTGDIFLLGSDDHGTHVAGTIGAEGGNALGVVGVNWEINIISGKFLGPGGGSTSDAIQVIDYMTALKTKKLLNIVALNNSWGGGAFDTALLDAIVRAANAQILFVASAGNGDWRGRAINTDSKPQYPACYNTTSGAGYDSVISVTAINSSGAKPSFANYGATTVDLGAPGAGIYSTVPEDAYAPYDGTSMAAPHVTGAIALYAAKYPNVSAKAIRDALFQSVEPTSSMSSTVTKGRVDITKMLEIRPAGWAPPTTAPSAPTALTAAALSHSEIKLMWADNSLNEAYFTITRSSAAGSVQINVPANVTAYTDTGLTSSTEYSYSIKAYNVVGYSTATQTASATTTQAPAMAIVKPPVIDSTTSGKWVGSYGRQGYQLFNSGYRVNPAYVTPAVTGFTPHTWASPSDGRGLQTPDTSSSFAVCYYTFDKTGEAGAFTIDLNFADNAEHRVSLYCVDYDNGKRQQKIQVVDRYYPATVLKEVSLNTFLEGKYVTFDIAGDVIIKILWVDNTATTADNAVVSGIFFDEPTSVPPPPTLEAPALTATVVSSSQIDLSWTPSDGATGYKIYRSVSGGTYGYVTTVEEISYSDSGLSASTPYSYYVKASNSAGDSAASNIADATTPPPSAPALVATAVSSSQIDLSWTPSSEATGYKIYKSVSGGSYAYVTTVIATSYSDMSVTASTLYSYYVVASSGNLDSGSSNIASATTPPSVPVLTAEAVSSSQIDLSWTVSSGATGYRLLRDGVEIADQTDTTYSDNGLAPSTSYSYKVVAYFLTATAESETVNATTLSAPAPTLPAAPSNLRATTVTKNSITLAWSDNSTDESNFVLESSRDTNPQWTIVATLPATTTTYVNRGLARTATYYYRIKAVNSGGSSDYAYSEAIKTSSR